MGTNPREWPLHVALAAIGGRWKLALVCRIMDGLDRPAGIKRSLPGISEKTLAQALKELERDGIIVRHDTPTGRRPGSRFTVTTLGKALQPVADAVYAWGVLAQAESRAKD